MNINNQTEHKKPLGSRLLILFTVCMIVVAMAIPAFAFEYEASELPYSQMKPFPSEYGLAAMLSGTIKFLVIDESNVVTYDSATNHLQVSGAYSWWTFHSTQLEWVYPAEVTSGMSYEISGSLSDFLYFTTVPIYDLAGNVIFPPPDLSGSVNEALPTVLSWIQQTLNALFVEGGALQGLLLLVAVPVAITLLFLAARFIRDLIWGA